MNTKSSFKSLLTKDYVSQISKAILGTVLFSAGVNLFIVPAGLYNGGFVGIGQIIRTILVDILGLPFHSFDIAGLIYYLCNIPLFFLAYRSISKRFFLNTLICVTGQTVFLTIIPCPSEPIVAETITACLIGGILAGAGTGMTLKYGASGGGQDILGIYYSYRKPNFSVGKMGLIINICVYAVCAILFDIKVVIYSVIYTTILSLVTDRIHVQNIVAKVEILTKTNPESIRDYLKNTLHRGSTIYNAVGGYTNEPTNVIMTVLSEYEYGLLQDALKEIDPHAFTIHVSGVDVVGEYAKHL